MSERDPDSTFQTIDPAALAAISGGLITPPQNPDPALVQGIQQLAQAMASVGQSLQGEKQAKSQQMMQLLQQKMQQPGGQ